MKDKVRIVDIKELEVIIDYEQNNDNNIDVSRIVVNSSKELFWKCKKGHSFKEKARVVHKRKNKCFYCTGRLIWSGENDLQTLYPELAKEFDTDKNGITPDTVSPKDTKSYWWKCKEKHPSFLQSVEHRVNRKTVCPYCSGRLVIQGENDLETLYPEIAKEWDIEKNNGVLPREVSPFSYNSYWWKCPKGHSYRKKVVKRTRYHQPIDCTKCVKARSTSFPEQVIYYYAKKCFPDAINRYKEPFEKGMELDIYIPTYKVGIEYDGMAFHNDKAQHDRERRKYMACRQLGIRLVRVKESMDTWNDTADDIFYIKKRMKDIELTHFLSFFFGNVFGYKKYTFTKGSPEESLLNRYYGFPTDFDVSRDRPEILEYLIDVEQSLGAQHPEIAAMWDNDMNGSLTPFMFTSGSNYEPIWKCPKCGNTWKSPIVSMVSRKVKSCRACSMKENGKNTTKQKTEKYGSLAVRSKELLQQWDFERNGGLSPYEIPLNYSRNVFWVCDECGYRWQSSPNSRVRKDNLAGCPHCSGRVPLTGVDDFATLYPDLAKQWNYEKNKLLPSQIKPHTNKKFYWNCPLCGNSFEAYPSSRINGSVCPNCSRKRIGKKNSKRVGQFDDAGILVETFDGLHEAARTMGITTNSIFQAVKSGRKSKGFYWRYIDDIDK